MLALLLSSPLCGGCGDVNVDATKLAGGPPTHQFIETFDTLDTSLWKCEYSCPSVADGVATFALLPDVEPEHDGAWSKIRYLPRRFSSGTFTVRFALGPRPSEPVWWGVALWDPGPVADESQYSEIYFGYRTDGSLNDSQFLLESAKRGHNQALTADTDVDLYDGSFHTGKLVYTPTRIDVYFDDQLLQSITDAAVIPTDAMDFILGTRLVTTPVLASGFDDSIDSCTIEW